MLSHNLIQTSIEQLCTFSVKAWFRGGVRGGHSYEFPQIIHLVKYKWIAVRSGCKYIEGAVLKSM